MTNTARDEGSVAAYDPWCLPWREGLDCMNDGGNCRDCGHGPDDLCPVLALPEVLAVAATVAGVTL